ncbi:MAG: T9SS type A sorting domain-containing protein [Bacteroidia bacterium]|nr:T9SS type A sorting domain-containing protein [Bacteroidia bacterium]
MMRLWFIALLLSSSWLASAQIEQYLSNYSIIDENNLPLISWTTSSGFTCEDIKIEHGVDSNDLKPVYTYPGICGAENKEERYTYLFRDIVYNKPNYFRIDLGTYGVSPILKITLTSLDGLQPKIYPNPTDANGTLVFSNDDREEATVQMYTAEGRQVGRKVVTRGKQVSLDQFNLPRAGVYFYTVQLNGVLTRGKFIFL